MTLYTIKPLAWEEKRTPAGTIYWEAETPFGTLQIIDRAAPSTPGVRFYWSISNNQEDHDGFARDLDAAKSAAESWYRAKMCEGLEVAKPQVEYRYERDAIDAG